jgi:hypothetical protein
VVVIAWTGRDDECPVSVSAQVLEDAQDGVGHPVDLGQEALGDDRDTHSPTVQPQVVQAALDWVTDRRTITEHLATGLTLTWTSSPRHLVDAYRPPGAATLVRHDRLVVQARSAG